MRLEKAKSWLLSTRGVIIASSALLVVAALESSVLPWAPFFLILMAAAIVLPIWLRSFRLGSLKATFKKHWLLIVVVWALAVLLDQSSTGILSDRFWKALGRAGDSFYSVTAFIDLIFRTITARMGISLDAAQTVFALVALVWAPIGEELFYRGYIFGTLREKKGFGFATLASAFFFGFRHALPVLYLLPGFHWLPALTWGLMAFGYGLLNNYLYEKTGSLYPGMIGHLVVNGASLLLTM